MAFFKLFSGKTPQDLETRGDALCGAGEYGLARLEYDKGLEKCRRKSPGDKGLEKRLIQKIRGACEALAQRHRQEGLEILESGYHEAAEETFQLALTLTEDPELTRELKSLLEKIRRTRREGAASEHPEAILFEEDVVETRRDSHIEEVFAALVSSLPVQSRKSFMSYGNAFKEGYVALNEGRFETSARFLEEALDENPEGDRILPELATAYLNLEMYTEAWDLAEAFIESHPDEIQGWVVLAEVLWALGEYDTALGKLEAAPTSLAATQPFLHLRGETLLRSGRPGDAERLYRQVLDITGPAPDTLRALAGVYEVMERKDEARDLYGRILNECGALGGPGESLAKHRFAVLSFELGERSPALLKIFLSLVQENPAELDYYRDKINIIREAL